jgi:hypothetical protein
VNQRYERQLREKIERAESEYKALGGTRISIAARAALPKIKAQLKLVKESEVVDKERVKRLQARITDLNTILNPPRRKVHTTSVYYATTPNRVMDYDGEENNHIVFSKGGTITTRAARFDVTDPSQADHNHLFQPCREVIRSDKTDEQQLLKNRLAWYRSMIAATLKSGSTSQWLLTR